MENSYRNRRQKWTNIGVTIAVVAALFAIAYMVADKFGSQSSRIADRIEIFVPEKGSQVFVDGKVMQVTDANNRKITVTDLAKGQHVILIAKENYWPWSKKIDLNNENAEISAFNAPTKPLTSVLPAGSKEYAAAARLLDSYQLPAPNEATLSLKKLESKDGTMEIWVQGNVINAAWISERKPGAFFDPDRSACEGEVCLKWVEVIETAKPIRNLAFYKERNDVLIFSSGDSIYAVEVNKEDTQNFQPVYKGTSPAFVNSEERNFIYVRDDGKIMKLML